MLLWVASLYWETMWSFILTFLGKQCWYLILYPHTNTHTHMLADMRPQPIVVAIVLLVPPGAKCVLAVHLDLGLCLAPQAQLYKVLGPLDPLGCLMQLDTRYFKKTGIHCSLLESIPGVVPVEPDCDFF